MKLFTLATMLFISLFIISCGDKTTLYPTGDSDIHTADTDNNSMDSDVSIPDDDNDSSIDDVSPPDSDETTDENADETVDETADEDSAPPLTITDITITANPNSTISCIVSWKTDKPSDSAVIFYAEVAKKFIITDEIETTDHRVAVVGMIENKEYTISVKSSDTEKSAGTFTTSALPTHLKNITPAVNQAEKTYNGWTVITVVAMIYPEEGHRDKDPDFPTTLLAFDMEGNIVWYSVQAAMGVGDTHYYPWLQRISTTTTRSNGTDSQPAYEEVNWEGNVVFDAIKQPFDPDKKEEVRYHHAFERIDNKHLWALKKTSRIVHDNDNNRDIKVVGDKLVELDETGGVLWSWDIFDHEIFDPATLPLNQDAIDWTHANSFTFSNDRKYVYFNSRHLSAIYKIEHATGNVVWRFGEGLDFTPAAGEPTTEFWPHYQHAIEMQKNGNILLYDNGSMQKNNVRDYSRAIEYKLDEVNMTAKIVWQYGNQVDDTWQTLYWGDADRLPNGNILIAACTFDETPVPALKEIAADGEKVWELTFPHPELGPVWGFYNAERILPPIHILP